MKSHARSGLLACCLAVLSTGLGCDAGTPVMFVPDAPYDGVDDPVDALDASGAGEHEPAFLQPSGVAVVGLDDFDATTVYYATSGSTGGFGHFPLTAAGVATPSLRLPALARITPDQAKPFATMTIEGEDFTTDPSAAVSVVFQAPGLAPVAVPALMLTQTSITITAPVLLGDDGLDARGTASVRVVEVLGDAHVVSLPLDGVLIDRLPPIVDGPPAGTLTAMFLLRTSTFARDSLESAARPLPSDFAGAVGQLADELEILGVAYQQAAAGDAPSVTPPWSSAEPPVLDTATLDLTDRLVFAALRAQNAAIQADLERSTTASYRQKSNPYGCSDPNLEGTPEQQMESLVCMSQGHLAATARVGQPAVALGFQVVTSVYTGFWGGSAAAVLAVRSKQTALAFEVAWAGLGGHLSAWMTGQQRPTAGQTLADSGATLADRMLGTGGVLDTVWTMISFGRSYDALVREAASTGGGGDGPDVGTDTGGDIGTDAGGDTGDDDGYVGTAALSGEFYGPDCVHDSLLTLRVVIPDLAGSGTPGSPFRGTVRVSGSLAVSVAPPCDGGVQELDEFIGTVAGTAGRVEFEASAPWGASMLNLRFTDGVLAGDEIDGWLTGSLDHPEGVLGDWEGGLTLASQ